MADEDIDHSALMGLIKRRGNAVSHVISFAMLSSLLGINLYGENVGIATHAYVDEKVRIATTQVEDNRQKLNRLLELQIADQIDKLLRWKCMNPGDTTFDAQLRDLERDYREVSGQVYQRPDCAFLIG